MSFYSLINNYKIPCVFLFFFKNSLLFFLIKLPGEQTARQLKTDTNMFRTIIARSLSSSLSMSKSNHTADLHLRNAFEFSNRKEALKWHGTTILSVKKNKEIVLIGDGQVSYGSMRIKTNGRKIRKIGDNVLCGFAGKILEVSYPKQD